MIKIFKDLSKELKSKFYYNYNTSKNSWFRAGGEANIFCIVYDENDFKILLENCVGIPYEIIGAGSNILIRDSGFKGIIFKLGKNFNTLNLFESHLEVGAGIMDINLSKFAQKNNIKNFEFYSGIPGTIGGAVKMNAGCYGSETKDSLKKIKTISPEGKIQNYKNKDLKLSYRNSEIPAGHIILSAQYNYNVGDKDEIAFKINEIKDMREKSQPLKTKTGGSTFKNPKNNHAAKLIEMAGCKGLSVGGACVSRKHANFLINVNNAKANDIEELGKKIIDRVHKNFDIVLEWEIKILG